MALLSMCFRHLHTAQPCVVGGEGLPQEGHTLRVTPPPGRRDGGRQVPDCRPELPPGPSASQRWATSSPAWRRCSTRRTGRSRACPGTWRSWPRVCRAQRRGKALLNRHRQPNDAQCRGAPPIRPFSVSQRAEGVVWPLPTPMGTTHACEHGCGCTSGPPN